MSFLKAEWRKLAIANYEVDPTILEDYDIRLDFGLTYGPSFEFLNSQTPTSVMLAEGSEITVESKRGITY